MEEIYIGLTPTEIQDEVDSYDGAIAYVDNHLQDLLISLEQCGKLDNTVVFILSDHGESFGEHNLLEHHNSLYREIIRVPLIIQWKGVIPENTRIDTPVSLVSLPATWMEIAGAKESGVFPSPSLALLWKESSGEQDWPSPISESVQVWWVPPQHLTYHGIMRSVYSPVSHYIYHQKFGEELYDWKSDPQEMVNLAGKSDQQSTLDMFRQYLKNWVGADGFWGE
jgi:arylsulfatase A-like enzyme